MENYYKELPNGYVESKVIDAKDKKTGLIMNLVGLLITVAVIVILGFIRSKQIEILFEALKEEFIVNYLIFFGVFFGSYFIYIILHELTHGLAYKILTKQKASSVNFTACLLPF